MADGRGWRSRALVGAVAGLIAGVIGLFLPLFIAMASKGSGALASPFVATGLLILCFAPLPGVIGGPILCIPLNGLLWGWTAAVLGTKEPRARAAKLVTWTLWACWLV